MSEELINRNPDLQRLFDEGYEVEVRSGYLLLHSVPYVNAHREVQLGIVVTDLNISGDQLGTPGDHQVWFAGEFPCNHTGSPISAISNTSGTQTLCEGFEVHHRFSCRPPEGLYTDYYAKMTRYVEIISNQARAIDPCATARTYRRILPSEEDAVFKYLDSASSRAGIVTLGKKLAMRRIDIIGLGGTGSYVLDLVAKTYVREVHLFDGDEFQNHNAFRAPGAASHQALSRKPSKVAYFAEMYSNLRHGIVPHDLYIDEATSENLVDSDFVFICIDKPSARKLISDFLRGQSIPFIDVGMELELLDDLRCLIGTCRVTLSTPQKSDHVARHVPLSDEVTDDLYRTNIQVADLNALNAAMAVIKWKKYCGFYQDCYKEHQSAYAINAHQLTRDETGET